MTHGTPDWGFGKLATVHVLSEDLAELSARLGSIHVYDRRGYVVWWDDFRNGMQAWVSGEYGTGAEIKLHPGYPKWPPYCVKVTAGSDGTRMASITAYLNPLALSSFGLEISMAIFSRWDFSLIELERYDGDTLYDATIRLDDDERKIYYLDENNSYQEIDDLPDLVMAYGTYHNCKLVADFETNEYVRFMLNQTTLDLSAYAIRQTPYDAPPHILVRLCHRGRAGENDYCHVDGVIVTQNEP